MYELEHYNIRYRPEPDTDPFRFAVRGGVGVMSAKVTEDLSVPANEDKYLLNTAKRNGNLFLRYAPAGAWYAEVGVTHTSRRYTNALNAAIVPGYTR
ncbi:MULTISPECIES: hypothetical protein [unclassified Acidovorax]|uniref:hypothetical protein n=1 Tax=unclassified Acidovorax TaxID=2684926 RepID=UPI0028834D4C|nr:MULTISPECIES: hypothetical protein [unclassified Acidovorax]